jgi:hypothetical protein
LCIIAINDSEDRVVSFIQSNGGHITFDGCMKIDETKYPMKKQLEEFVAKVFAK